MRVVSTRVLPLPAPARISADACGSVTAASCSGLRFSREVRHVRHERANGLHRADRGNVPAKRSCEARSGRPRASAESTARYNRRRRWPATETRARPMTRLRRTRRRCARSCTGSAAAAPYVHAFRGKTFVIAFGGEVVADDTFLGVIHDLNLLHSLGIRLVVVHGCRPQVEAILDAQGIPSRYANGVRVTDSEAMDCVLEAAGQVRARIEALLSLGLANSPMAGARNRVSSGNYLTAKPMGVVDGIDMQLTGEVRRIDTEAIQQRLDDGDIVLISPIGYSPTGEIFNLTVEEVATQVRGADGCARSSIFLMDADGVRNGAPATAVRPVDDATRKRCSPGRTGLPPDMRRLSPAAIRACNNGVKRAHLISRHHDGALLLELFTRDGVGTMIAAHGARPPAQRDDRRRRRHPRRSSSRWRNRACWCAARASGWRARSSASSWRSTMATSSAARRCTRFPSETRRRAGGAGRASGFPPRRLWRGADARDRAARAQAATHRAVRAHDTNGALVSRARIPYRERSPICRSRSRRSTITSGNRWCTSSTLVVPRQVA